MKKISANVKKSTPLTLSDEKVCAVIKMDYQIQGNISVDEQGCRFLEGDLSLPKWQQGYAYALGLATLIEQEHGLEDGSVKCRLRVTQIQGNEINPQIVLVALSAEKIDHNKTKILAREFARQVSRQRELQQTDVQEKIDAQASARVSEVASIFLQAHGGQMVQRQLQICVHQEMIGNIKGQWNATQLAPQKEKEIRNLQVFFDGRRLRTRVMFVVEAGARAKSHEIFYNEEEFDQQLIELRDDKSAALEIAVMEEWDDKGKSRLSLVALKRFKIPDALVLE